MNNYELNSSKLFNANLEAALAGLAAAWGVSSENNPAIEEVRKAAHFNVLGRTTLRLVRITNQSPFEEHKSFFEGLTAKEYSPHLYGTEIKPGTAEHAQAKKLLKDFANYVGHTVIREQSAKISKDPAWLETGLIPSDNGIVVTDTGLSHEDIDWGAPTIPADLPQDEQSKLRDEKSRMTEIIKGASPSDVRTYLKNTLRPRFVEVINELKDRREKYTNQTSFEIREGALIDFKASLITVMQQALEKMAAPRAVQQADVAPYPILIADNDVAVATAKKIEPSRVRVEEQLKALQTRIDGYTNQLSGAALKEYYRDHLKPKYASLIEDVFTLSHAGNDPVMLDIKEKHLAIIQSGMSAALHKMNAEINSDLRAREAAEKPAAQTAVATPDQTEALRRKAWEDSLPVLTDVITFPLQTTRDVSEATTVPFQDVKEEPKKPTSWLRRAAVAAAFVGVTVATIVGGFVGGIAHKEYKAEAAREKVAATAQFNAKANAPTATIVVAPAAANIEPVAAPVVTPIVAPAEETPVAAKVEKDPTPQKQAKAKAAFQPAAAANDATVTAKPVIEQPFDIATSISGLDTWSRACDYLEANNNLVKDGVCPINPNRSPI